MKKLFAIILLILASEAMGWWLAGIYRNAGKITITGVYPDDRGYTSVTFIQDGKEYGYDYLTPKEYLQFINQK